MSRLLKPVGTILLILFLIVQLLSLNLRGKEALTAPERVVVWLAAPVQKGASAIIGWAGNIWTSYFALVGTAKQNKQLVIERSRLERKLVELREVKIENQHLRQLLEMSTHGELRLLAAERIAAGVSPYERTIRISRGQRDGLEEGMAVISSNGVVGQALKVYGTTSDILLLVDAASAVDVVSLRSRARGILRGSGSNQLRFEYLPKGEDLQVGDELVTSGFDAVYPQGIAVGVVSQVDSSDEGLFLSAHVRPYVDFRRVEDVAVVTGKR